ncbi:MAG TPA: DUF551 domain-containing protein [Ferrovaceae bacterium]|nr:DUF551 domain-containing protein [Ferrovaceae bacterium]
MSKMSNWISVKDRLPALTKAEYKWECSEWVLGVITTDLYNFKFHAIVICEKYENKEPQFSDGENKYDLNDVTHWMPLPELPKE